MKKQLLSLIFLFLVVLNSTAIIFTDNLLITAKMDGSQEVPAVATMGQGVASLLLNSGRDSICINATVTGLSGPITGAHIHEGDSGVSGGIVISLMPLVSGNRIAGILTGSNISELNISKLLSGKFYINVHTSAHPAGEIRGQLSLETDYSFPLMLDGSQEVPAVTTGAYGVGFLTLSRDLSSMHFNMIMQDLSGTVTGAHLHFGSPGISGIVALALTSNVNGKVLSGTISSPSPSLIDSLIRSKIYINVHTSANPNGEIRSQLRTDNYLYFDAILGGNQETPPVNTNAKGSAILMLNTTFDTLWYDMAAEGLSGNITGAHFHNGSFANAGPVVISLNSSIIGNRIQGSVSGTILTTGLINKFLKGEMYVNLHTAANPNGEIRGQVYRTAREGLTFSMDGDHEVPPVTTTATGSGIVSIDRDNDNIHFMVVADGIAITGAHFHTGMTGEEGPVIFPLTSLLLNNAAFGYWKSTDTIPFDSAISDQLQKDSIYINFHSSANPAGEIRGQVSGGFRCNYISSGIAEKKPEQVERKLYPNPSSDLLTVEFTKTSGYASMIIHDILGKEVFSKVFILEEGTSHKTIDTKDLPAGLYFLKIITGKDQFIRKFSKS